MSSVLAGLVLAGLVELWALWLAGVEYKPPWALRRVMVSHFSVSADGRRAVSRMWLVRRLQNGRENEVVLHDLLKSHLVRLDLKHLRSRSVALAPRGDRFALGSDDGSLYLGSFKSKQELQLLHRGADCRPVSQVAFSPDGSFLAAVAARTLILVDIPRRELRGIISFNAKHPVVLAISENSRRLLTCDDGNTLRLWCAADGTAIAAVPMADSAVLGAALSCDGREATWVTADGSLRRWDFAADGELPRRHLRHRVGVAIAFSTDGRFLATSSPTAYPDSIHVYDAVTGEFLRSLDGHADRIAELRFLADGELYSWDPQGTIQAWTLDQSQQPRRFSMLQKAATWSP